MAAAVTKYANLDYGTEVVTSLGRRGKETGTAEKIAQKKKESKDTHKNKRTRHAFPRSFEFGHFFCLY